MHTLKRYARYLPLTLGLILLAAAAWITPWGKVWPYLSRISPLAWGCIIGLSAVYYLGRILRYYVILRMLGRGAKFYLVALAVLVAQPVSVLPGGEFYRTVMLKRYANVDYVDSTAGVVAQSLCESFGLIIIALIGAAVLRRYLIITSLLTIGVIAVIILVNRYGGQGAARVIRAVPGLKLHPLRLRAYMRRNQQLLSGANLFILFGVTFICTAAGIAILAVGAVAIGHALTLPQAAIAFALPTTLEALSFLPGGMGLNEGSSVAILALFRIALPAAIALTIMVRIFTLGIGFGYGFAAMAVARLGNFKQYE